MEPHTPYGGDPSQITAAARRLLLGEKAARGRPLMPNSNREM